MVSVLIFVLVRFIPGSPAQVMLPDDATQEEIAALEERMGLDQPIPVQFAKWIGSAIQGDLGDSLYYNRPVTELLFDRLAPTLL